MIKPDTKYLLPFLMLLAVIFKTDAQVKTSSELVTKFLKLSDTTKWKMAGSVPLAFPAHHPQGMVKIGSYFFMSSVEVINRTAGKGIGHLFKFDKDGKLLADVVLGEGAIYHPGGIDYDGKYIWVPVSEYRPDSRSIVYKINPETLSKTEVFRFNDHLGGIVHNTQANTLHAVSWGSRKYYDWKLVGKGNVKQPNDNRAIINQSFYIDYQDCHYVGNNLMLCSGLKNYKNGTNGFGLGGLELVNLKTHQPVFQLPVLLWSPSGKPMTQNPFWMETTHEGLRVYFVPDDDNATLYAYDIKVD